MVRPVQLLLRTEIISGRPLVPPTKTTISSSAKQTAPARQSGAPAALPALVPPLDSPSEATPQAKWNPQRGNPSAAGTRTGESAVTHGPRVLLVTWPCAGEPLMRSANPARVRRGLQLLILRARPCSPPRIHSGRFQASAILSRRGSAVWSSFADSGPRAARVRPQPAPVAAAR